MSLSTVERLIRKHISGASLTKARKEARDIAASPVAVAQFRALATNPHAIIPPVACEALANELERIAKDKARTIATNKEITKAQTDGCPCCGRKIKRNLSLTGWWQCSQFGAVGFRAESDKPACNWQAFYVEGV